ncbi:hypothetical protein F5X71_27495 [Nocardia brasiliensis]|uniref:M48 family metalloprotease n=1 Tax=Nocardia brasiliensis TaxID=37326 RepID=A0A6G9XXB4_NOCBR|nr:hypothetical protein [Nocardia brasiliensis]QIS05558.1 hypothetical protein F5X71_27495 [Nocardia brasiliensis]
MTSEVIAKANYPGGAAVARRSIADRVRGGTELLLAAMPSAAVLTVLLYGLGRAAGVGVPGALAAAWFMVCAACAAARLLIPDQRWLLRIFGLRPPTDEERVRLAPAWEHAAHKVGVPAADYTVWVQEVDRQFVVSDRMITVAPEALERLRRAELEAVLIHQLAQRVQGRMTFWQLILRHYNLPIVWIERALTSGVGLRTLGEAITEALPARGARVFSIGWTVFSRTLVACPAVAAATVIIGLAPALLLRLLPEVAVFALRPIADRVEYRTDQITVDLGYGPELGGILQYRHVPEPAHTLPDLLSVSQFSVRTPPGKRIGRIRDRLDELARRWHPGSTSHPPA